MKTMSRTKNRWPGSTARLLLVGVACVAALLPSVSSPAGASAHGQPPAAVPPFVGAPAMPRPVVAPAVPRHPFMAPNGRSNLHDDAYMSDTYVTSGPLGRRMRARLAVLGGLCGTITFDRKGRIEAICINGATGGVRLVLLAPTSLAVSATMALPPRSRTSGANPFQEFTGGGYFYLDQKGRAVLPTTSKHIYVVAEHDGPQGPRFVRTHDYDVSAAIPAGDKISSVLPDWQGRLWFVTRDKGDVGVLDPATGRVQTHQLGEEIENSFAVDETGGVFIVSNKALYRFDAGPGAAPVVTWRQVYPNSGLHKPGQVNAGSGTTPTLMGRAYVSITDNADPMDVLVYRRARRVSGSRLVCRQPVFTRGASATENSLIGTATAMIVENNYGYTGAMATSRSGVTTPGLARVDINRNGTGCHVVWTSGERAPSVVPKLSLANGLVYTYTKPAGKVAAWYLTALDFRTGRTVYKQLAGIGLLYNNNYSGIVLNPEGTAYVGVLGGLVALRDGGTGARS
jgi:hypothetical protein